MSQECLASANPNGGGLPGPAPIVWPMGSPNFLWRGFSLSLELHREIATLESDLAAARTQNAILESLSRQRIVRDNSEIEAARNWRDLCALMKKARGE